MNCACATFRSKLEKFRRNFSSLNSINSKWRRLEEPVVMCQQGEFDCNKKPMSIIKTQGESCHKGIIWKEKYIVLFLANFLSNIYGPPVCPGNDAFT